MQKPMLSVDELIEHMKNKGITFSIMSENDAKEYLLKNNNYFKLSAYRKNYRKYKNKNNNEVYEILDFAYLVELARIDVQLRHVFLGICLDIEHALKVEIIKAIEKDTAHDGYSIVAEYNSQTNIISEKIRKNTHNPYCGNLITKYKNKMPIWAFVEIISFGDLLRFGDFMVKQHKWKFPVDRKSLDRVRQLRNAAAHNNCMLNDLCVVINPQTKKIKHKEPQYITQFLLNMGISKTIMHKKLSNPRFSQMIHVLFIYSSLVKTGDTRNRRIQELKTLVAMRMKENKLYFEKNKLLLTTYEVFKTVVDRICQ